MAEYIDIDTPLEAHRVRGNQRDQISTTLRELLDFNKIPYTVADVRPVVRGKWIDMGDFISCSSCNATHLKEFESDYGKAMRLDARTNFCPNCGAIMDKEDTNGSQTD